MPLGDVFDFGVVDLSAGLVPLGDVLACGNVGLAVGFVPLGNVIEFVDVFKGSLDKVGSSSDCFVVNEVSGLAEASFIEVVLKIESAWYRGGCSDPKL